MSKIGKQHIKVPSQVEVEIGENKVLIKGPKGSIERKVVNPIGVKIENGEIEVYKKKDSPNANALYGTTRAHLANMVIGVTDGWTKVLEMVGAGYRAEVVGKDLVLNVGYSHPVKITPPDGVSFKVEKMDITVSGIDIEAVGEISAKIRRVRPPEPYKGKGIRYKGEYVRKKAGKAAKTAA